MFIRGGNLVWIMYEYMLDGNGQWSLGDILYLATSWIPALDGVLPPLVVKSKDTSTYQSHSYPFHGRRLWCDEMPYVCVIPLYVTDCEGFLSPLGDLEMDLSGDIPSIPSIPSIRNI